MNTPDRLSPAPAAQQTLAGPRPLDADYMDDTPSKENPAKDFNKLDLTQLQGFSFGTQWTQDKTSGPEQRERSDRPRREGGPDRREGPGGGGPDRRDRRAFRKPAGGDHVGGSGSAGGVGGGSSGTSAQPRREYSQDRGPRRDFQGGPRRESSGERGGPRYGGGYGGREQQQDRGPYESPLFSVAFYPEDTSFSALAKTIRTSCRTIELFEIARTVIGKSDRFVVVLARKSPAAGEQKAAAEAAGAATPKQAIYLSVPDGVPFESDEAALNHVLTTHLGRFFDTAEVEVEPPKGNFQVINKCGITGELLGPPNYHRYQQIVQQHYAAKISRMPLEAFRSRIETVRDPEVVAQWLAKMKKTTRYTWKQSAKPVTPVAPAQTTPAAPAETVATDQAAPEVAAVATGEVAMQESSTTPETAPALTFDTFEDARTYLLTHAREKLVRSVETARFHGKLIETMPAGEIRRAVEGALERQRRFPLDTANALRGRLRREHFTIFKKGSKGISYVCAVKRKFRVPGQTFAESISALISFIEGHPMVRASELTSKFLGIDLPAAPKADAVPAEAAPAAAAGEGAAAPKAEPVLTIDQRAKISRMQGDLRWLVTEGYVTEFIDGRLFAPPPMVEARKKEVESEDQDPENFP
ncbi:MAG TPA: hypothetical protein VEQ65_06390, partial [Opitutus sp.]|nr:hypothetical protein [Opitutus sp.]